MNVTQLASEIRTGSTRALARGLTWIEEGSPRAEALVDALYPHTGLSHVIGITGAPGAGKSTLVQGLAAEYRRRDYTVGILAVDPSSPFTGGALLGDRVRMPDVAGDPGVFIRSMATRGALGGLSRQAADAIEIMSASGRQVVLVETVGVGQDEVEIMRVAHTTVVVSVPGLGDDVQALKAGIIEIADIHVVNKADREGAQRTAADLRTMLSMSAQASAWMPPIVACVASRGEGVPMLVDEILNHLSYLSSGQELARRRRRIAEARVLKLAESLLFDTLRPALIPDDPLGEEIDRVARREVSPFDCARDLLTRASHLVKVTNHV